MDALDKLNVVVTYVLICAGTPAQGLLAGLWLFTRRWRGDPLVTWYVLGRLAWFFLLLNSFIVLTVYGMRPLDWPAWLILIRVVTYTFILVVIYGQLFNLIHEMTAVYQRRKK